MASNSLQCSLANHPQFGADGNGEWRTGRGRQTSTCAYCPGWRKRERSSSSSRPIGNQIEDCVEFTRPPCCCCVALPLLCTICAGLELSCIFLVDDSRPTLDVERSVEESVDAGALVVAKVVVEAELRGEPCWRERDVSPLWLMLLHRFGLLGHKPEWRAHHVAGLLRQVGPALLPLHTPLLTEVPHPASVAQSEKAT